MQVVCTVVCTCVTCKPGPPPQHAMQPPCRSPISNLPSHENELKVPGIAYINGHPAGTSAALLPIQSPWRKTPMPQRKRWQRQQRRCSMGPACNLRQGSFPISLILHLKLTGSTWCYRFVWPCAHHSSGSDCILCSLCSSHMVGQTVCAILL